MLSDTAVSLRCLRIFLMTAGSKALDKANSSGVGILLPETGLVGKVSGERAGDDTQYFSHQLWIGCKKEAQGERYC